MGHTRTDIFLLSSGRNVYTLISKGIDISTYGAQTTTKDVVSQVFLRKMDALIKGFLGNPQDPGPP